MGPNTLVHNDYRVDNQLWDGDELRRALVFGFMWPLGMMGGYATLEPRSRQLANTMLERHLSAVRDVGALSPYP